MIKMSSIVYKNMTRMILMQEKVCGTVQDKVEDCMNCSLPKMLGILLATKVLQGIGPQQVAHRAERGGLLESVQLKIENLNINIKRLPRFRVLSSYLAFGIFESLSFWRFR